MMKKNLLAFLVKRIKQNKEVNLPLSKIFLKRYKKLNKKAYELMVEQKK